MNKDMILGLVRHGLTFAGGYIVAKGWADSAAVNDIIGALFTLVGGVWSIVHKVNNPSATAPATAAVITSPTATQSSGSSSSSSR